MNRCAYWIVSNRKYAEEAARSASELKELMPEIDRFLFTAEKFKSDAFTRVALMSAPEEEYWYLDSTRYFCLAFKMIDQVGYHQAVYFDSDVNFIAPFPELFDMLNRFDIVAPIGSRRVTGATFETLPMCFPEYEIGVVAHRMNSRIYDLFITWRDLHHAHPDIYGNNDMRSFREAVWNSPDVKIERIPSEYALRWPFGVFMSLPVKILHGRELGPDYPDSPTVADVKRIVNEHLDMRIWSPRDPDWRDGVIPKDYEGK